MRDHDRARSAVYCGVLSALSLAFGGALGCGGDDSSGSSGSACDTGITLSGVVKELTPGVERQQYPGLAGVKVCLFEHDDVPCVTTGKEGTYDLCGVPTDSEVMVAFTKADYGRSMREIITKKTDYEILAETVLGSAELAETQAMLHGLDPDELTGGGAVQFFAAEPSNGVLQVATVSDFVATLETSTGDAALCPTKTDDKHVCTPFYLGPDGDVDPKATKSSRLGVGGFANVPPGEYVLRIKQPDLECTGHLVEAGWTAKDADTVRVRVVKGWVTAQEGLFCEEPE